MLSAACGALKRNTISPALQSVMLSALGLLCAGVRLYYAAHGVPIPLGDSIWFYPVAHEFATHGDLAHPFLSPFAPGGGPYTWHGWLYPVVLAKLSWCFSPGLPGLLSAEAWIMAGAFMAMAHLLARRVSAPLLLKFAVMIVWMNALWAGTGRPEFLAQVVLLIAAIAVRPITGHVRAIACGFALGALAAAQPTVAALSALVFVAYLAYELPRASWLRAAVAAAVAAVGTLAIATALTYPPGVHAWLHGLAAHAGVTANRSDTAGFGYYYALLPSQPLAGAWFIGGAVLLSCALWRTSRTPASPVIFYGTAAASLAFAWLVGVAHPATHYNVTVFIPWIALCAVALYEKLDTRADARAVTAVVVGLALVSALALSRAALVTWASMRSGVGSQEVAVAVHDQLAAGRSVVISAPLAMADMDLARHPRVTILRPGDPGAADLVFVQQAASGRSTPEPMNGLILVVDRFRRGRVSIGGLVLANTPLTYEYAVYSPAPAQSRDASNDPVAR